VRRLAVVIAACGAALGGPASAYAVDHVSLFVHPSTLGVGADWRLTASVPAREFIRGTEIVGITLTRRFRAGRAEELHALRGPVEIPTVAFDGRRGRWNVRNQLGPVLTANMAIVATAAARPLAEYRGCRGAWAQVPVALRGTFVLRTGTAFFDTIRRNRLRGVVIFNGGGPVDCTQPSPAVCSPEQTISVSNRAADIVSASPSRIGVQVREQVRGSRAAWYHVMSVLGADLLAVALPRVDVRVPSSQPIQGEGTFTAVETGAPSGPCRLTSTRGTFTGTFRTRFAGWGTHTLEFADAGGTYFVVPND
jgi:hypothetical protein